MMLRPVRPPAGLFGLLVLIVFESVPAVELHGMHEGAGFGWEHLFSAGGRHTCFVNQSKLICWGDDELGNTNPPEGRIAAVSSGAWHTCALDASGRASCFGSGYALNAQPPDEQLSMISAGFATSCGVVSKDGSLRCWGAASHMDPPATGQYSHVTVGTRTACAISSTSGSLVCWGGNEYKQVSDAPAQEAGFVSASCGGGHCCGLTTLGQAFCWGGSDAYNHGTSMGQVTARIIQVSSGEDHACALVDNGAVQCWGKCQKGACAPPTDEHGNPTQFVLIAAGSMHTCGVVAVSGQIKCWGDLPSEDPQISVEVRRSDRLKSIEAPTQAKEERLVDGSSQGFFGSLVEGIFGQKKTGKGSSEF